MAIASAKKIFVDPGEEITFLIERLLEAKDDRIILIIPQDSLIFSSIVGLRSLIRMTVKYEKTVIVVTEDEFGISAAQKIGYVTVPKVSQITEDLWDVAKTKLLNARSEIAAKLEQTKQEAIDASQDETDEDIKEEAGEESAPVDSKGSEGEEQEPESVDNENPLNNEEDVVESKGAKEKALEKETDDSRYEDMFPGVKKPDVKTKIVKKGNMNIVLGGDVRELRKSARMTDENAGRSMDRPLKGASYIGKDVTKASKKAKRGLLGLGKKAKSSEQKLREASMGAKRGKSFLNGFRSLAIVMFVVCALVLGGAYAGVNQMISYEITITFAKDAVSASDTITADPNATEVNLETLTIPGIVLEGAEISTSRSGTATGTGETGSKATGVVTFYNLTEEQVTLPVGTVLTYLGDTQKTYSLKQEVVLEASSATAENTVTSVTVEDVPIEASSFGEQFNLTKTDSNLTFQVADYVGQDQVFARGFRDITGGTSSSFTAVSEGNVDSLKTKLLEELSTEALEDIRGLVDPGFKILEGSFVFEEVQVSSRPDVGEAAGDSGTFNLSVSGKGTAIIVSDDDLDVITNYVISQNTQQAGDNSQIGTASSEIASLTRGEGDITTFTINASGQISERVSEVEIRKEIEGKSTEEVEAYFESIESIEKYVVRVTPGFAPDFMKRVPTDASKTTIEFE